MKRNPLEALDAAIDAHGGAQTVIAKTLRGLNGPGNADNSPADPLELYRCMVERDKRAAAAARDPRPEPPPEGTEDKPPPSPWRGPALSVVGPAWITAPRRPEPFIIAGRVPIDAIGFVGVGAGGKTTFLMWVGIHVILGRRVLDAEILHTGPVVLISGEDDLDTARDRLRDLCTALELAPAEWQEVAAGFHIEDVSGVAVRLVSDVQNVVGETLAAGQLIEAYRTLRPALMIIDPTSLLGPGERSGNDGMAELMRTCRRISRELGCAVPVVHHESKAGTRDGVHDQYSGRGGAAFADNSRGMMQLVPTEALAFDHPKGRKWLMPKHWTLEDAQAGNLMVLYLHKLSAGPRDRVPLVVRRHGWLFEVERAITTDGEEAREVARNENEQRVLDYVGSKLAEQVTHSRTSLEQAYQDIRIGRNVARSIVHDLIEKGLLVECSMDKSQGGKKTHLVPFNRVQGTL